MKNSTMFKVLFNFLIILFFTISFESNGQTQRNPVLEYCTGTWCVYCPQGHAIIHNDILPNIPNAVILGYHGPANGSDPFSFFPGNSIISSFGFSGYPTGIVDRVSGIQSRGAWYGLMNNRNSVPATIQIDMQRSFNANLREFNATIDFTALTNISGQFKYSVILVEDGMVWAQTGGSSNYVHEHVVREMMNGPLGEEVINGSWTQGQIITKTMNHICPVPGGPGPDVVFDSCRVAVLVYQVGTPLATNAEIQQAEQWTLIAPDYVATIQPSSPDVIADNNSPALFQTVIHNIGLLQDTYNISLEFDGPTAWTQEYTTINGTFPIGHIDQVTVASGDSTVIDVSVNPNSIDGYGVSGLKYISSNNPGNQGNALLRNVTTTGINFLIIDANENEYVDYIKNSLDNVYTGTYGVVSRTALHPVSVNLDNFEIMSWSQGEIFPVFVPEETSALQNYLDAGGNLFINGQDIGADIFESSGQSQFAQGFYNNYLHASYVGDASSWFLVNGYAGDPISDGIQFIIGNIHERSPDKIAPFDADATEILKYWNGPDVGGIRAASANYRVVYFATGFEQIVDEADRDTLMARIISWLGEGTTGIEEENMVVQIFQLQQNYPNPFNPETKIRYSLPADSRTQNVSLVIYNQLGEKVKTLVNKIQSAGKYETTWEGNNDSGNAVASGVYFYRIRYGDYDVTKKMILMR